MTILRYLLISFLIFNLTSCGESSDKRSAYAKDTLFTADTKQNQKNKYLAYWHKISIDLPKNTIHEVHQQIVDSCSNDQIHQCSILKSNINSGKYASSNITLRIKPEGLQNIISLASAKGKLTNQTTHAEDLQTSIVNTNKRLEMLNTYQERLLVLEKKSNSDVDALIKIASELSKTQSDLEYAQGEKAKLLQRTEMDIIDISLSSHSSDSFWGPILMSFSDFGTNLSDGIAETIDELAYFLPWALVLLLLFYIIRIVWRKTKG